MTYFLHYISLVELLIIFERKFLLVFFLFSFSFAMRCTPPKQFPKNREEAEKHLINLPNLVN